MYFPWVLVRIKYKLILNFPKIMACFVWQLWHVSIRRKNCTSLKKWSWQGNRDFEQITSVHRGFRFSCANLKANPHYQSEKKRSNTASSINNFFKQQWMSPIFNNLGIFPFLLLFSTKLSWYNQRSYDSRNHLIRTNSQTLQRIRVTCAQL